VKHSLLLALTAVILLAGTLTAVRATKAGAGPSSFAGGSVHVQSSTTHATIAGGSWQAVTAKCGPGEVVTGGGYSVGSIGSGWVINASGPTNDLDGWLLTLYNGSGVDFDVWVTALCAHGKAN